MTAVPPWLDWGRRLAAIAREGLTWSREPFDRDRYERVAAVADELLAGQAGPGLATDTLFPPGSGHPTPKVDVRAVDRARRARPARARAHRRRLGDAGRLGRPGAQAAQVAVKETIEEAGLEVRATRLLALWDRDAQGMGPYAHAVYKVYLACEPLDPAAEPVPGPEALDAGWFEPAAPPRAVADAQHGRAGPPAGRARGRSGGAGRVRLTPPVAPLSCSAVCRWPARASGSPWTR